MQPIKTIFIGTPDFAVPALRALVRDTDFKVELVITRPDAPAGRGLILTEPPIKQLALELKLPLSQSTTIKEALSQLQIISPDIIVVAAYAQIIPPAILELPRYGCLNIHPSLLPVYRGASPLHSVILNNDQATGVTIMKMDERLDTGPILAQEKITVSPEATTAELSKTLAELGAKLLTRTIKDWLAGRLEPRAQDNASASYAPQVTKANGLLNWSDPANKIEQRVRAYGDWPGAWTWAKGQQVKILAVEHNPLPLNTAKPGKTFIYNNQLAVQCGADALVISRLKLEGKKDISGQEFINGHRADIGLIWG